MSLAPDVTKGAGMAPGHGRDSTLMGVSNGGVGIGMAEPGRRAERIAIWLDGGIRRDGIAEHVRPKGFAEPLLRAPADALVDAALIQRFATPVNPERTCGPSAKQLNALDGEISLNH